MNTQITLISAAALLASGIWPLQASAQGVGAPAPTTASVPAAAKAPAAIKAPQDWIAYDDSTYTPVLDDVSRALAEVRAALDKKDNTKAATAMQAAASALRAQNQRVAEVERQHATVDLKHTRDTQIRLAALAHKLDATADQIRAGKVVTTAALDKTLDKAARADLERRWLVTDVVGWYPVSEEPQRHFGLAAEAYAKKDFKVAATEIRKAASFVRLESARTATDASKDLDAAASRLEAAARALDRGAHQSVAELDRTFATANHALALAQRANAAESWAHQAYNQAGFELKAAAYGLESAGAWSGSKAKAAAARSAADARSVGDKLASGGVWARDEVAKGFESLGSGLNELGHDIGAKAHAAAFEPAPAHQSG